MQHRLKLSFLFILFTIVFLFTGISETGISASATDTSFEVHFIDVGQGDCALILCDGQAMLIDGGEASQSSKVYAYLKEHGIDHLTIHSCARSCQSTQSFP